MTTTTTKTLKTLLVLALACGAAHVTASDEGELKSTLARHGLGDYADTLLKEHVTLEDMPELTDADLRDLHIPLYARIVMLKLISDGRFAADNWFARPDGTMMHKDVHSLPHGEKAMMMCLTDPACMVKLKKRMKQEYG